MVETYSVNKKSVAYTVNIRTIISILTEQDGNNRNEIEISVFSFFCGPYLLVINNYSNFRISSAYLTS
jgi:hypothetical protein